MNRGAYPTSAEFAAMTPDDFVAFWDVFEKMEMAKTKPFAGRFFLGRHDIRDICTLKRAGWTPEFVEPLSQPMSWYWRRPKRPGSRDRLGKQFKSTGMAMGELRRIAQSQSTVKMFPIEYRINGKPFRGHLPAAGFLHAQELADRIGGQVVQS